MTESEIARRIYPSVVTYAGNWRKMIEEVGKLRLKEISLFLTTVGVHERKEIYAKLAKTSVKRIPHVHARHDMKEEEFDYFVKKYKTHVFTIHFQFIPYVNTSKHRKIIFVENNFTPKKGSNLHRISSVGGICIDLSHWYQFARHTEHFHQRDKRMAQLFTVGCNHISAVDKDGWSWHKAKTKSEFDYLMNLPRKLFSPYLNLELTNSIQQQLEFRKYIAKILEQAWSTK